MVNECWSSELIGPGHEQDRGCGGLQRAPARSHVAPDGGLSALVSLCDEVVLALVNVLL